MNRATETVTLDTVQSSVWHLYHLLDVIMDRLVDMDYIRDGKRDLALECTAALAWMARDEAERIACSIDDNFHAIRQGGSS